MLPSSLAELGNPIIFAQDFIGSPLFFVIGAVVLLGLVGLLFYLRNKQGED